MSHHDTHDSSLEEEFGGSASHQEQAKKKRGRPPGSKTKSKEGGESPKPTPAHSVESLAKQTLTTTATAVDVRLDQALAAALDELLGRLEFKGLGTNRRWLLLLVRDTSPSEWNHEKDFREGGNSIPAEMQNDVLGRNLVDVMLAYGSEWFKAVTCAHAKAFQMPENVEHGSGTEATPWIDGIMQTVGAYQKHLAKHGLSMGGAVVVICSDFCFGDDFTEALERFREFQKANPSVFVVPAGYGDWMPNVAERFSVCVKPKDLNKKIRIAQFVKLVSRSISTATRSRAEQRLKIADDFNKLGE